MPQWWQKRYKHIREENPDMEKGMEYALATEQYKKEFGHPPKLHHKKSETIVKLLQLADKLDSKGLKVEANLIDRAWFDPKVMDRSVDRMVLPVSNRPNEPTEKNYCFNCGAPVLTPEAKCEVCNYEPTKREETPGFKV